MKREDIIKLAREAGVPGPTVWDDEEMNDVLAPHLAAFFALIAAAERNKVAAWMIEHSYATGHGDTIEDLLEALVEQVEERVTNAIRARGDHAQEK